MRLIVLCLLAFLLAVALQGCSSTPFFGVKGRSWAPNAIEYPPSIALEYPEVDRRLSAASIEAELARLAPLLFMEHGLPLATEVTTAEVGATEGGATPVGGTRVPCVAELRAIEREYTTGWKTKRSTTLDIVVRRAPEVDGTRTEVIVASRASAQGDVSLSSSPDLYRLLDTAVRELADRLRDAAPRASRDAR